MPRKKIGTKQWGCSVPLAAYKELREMLVKLNCLYDGGPSLGVFLTRIWKGELIVLEKFEIGVDGDNL